MRAVSVMFDSLNKKYLSPYGATDVYTPNFERLSKKAVTFDNFYCGSMPCMPARRELHTGRCNFLMRSWSPLEPFDESMPEILSQNGICSQFVSDHCHYWQDGGLTYHQRFTCFDFVRGQEGDEWRARAKGYGAKRQPKRQDKINREYTRDDECCHAKCFESAKDFLQNNIDEDNWYLHLEYFDPHEPFDAPDKFKKLYTDEPIPNDWGLYSKVAEQDAEVVRQSIINYKACVSMCDFYLGKLLDIFDENNLWEDTMLIVNTDHGFMLGEHGYFAKNYMPCYNELVNIPFFMYDPRNKCVSGERRNALTQTIDIAPTVLDFFNQEIPKAMMGKSLREPYNNDATIHEAVLFGYFGKHINITDGKYTYMRCARDNSKLFEYTLMPARLATQFVKDEIKLADNSLFRGFDYCDNVPMLKIPANTKYVPKGTYLDFDEHMKFGDLLFDLKKDSSQDNNIVDNLEIVNLMKDKMVALMKENEAPKEQYERMDLEYSVYK